jgi:hypothetical protein
MRALSAHLPDVLERTRTRWRDGEPFPGASTGLGDLDALIGGIEPGTTTVVGAPSGFLLSSIAATIALGLARTTPVIYRVVGRAPTDVGMHLLAAQARVSLPALARGRLAAEDWRRVDQAAAQLAASRIWLDPVSAEATPSTDGLWDLGLRASGEPGVVVFDRHRPHRGLCTPGPDAPPVPERSVPPAPGQAAVIVLVETRCPVADVGVLQVGDLPEVDRLWDTADTVLLAHETRQAVKSVPPRVTVEISMVKHPYGVGDSCRVAYLRGIGLLANLSDD